MDRKHFSRFSLALVPAVLVMPMLMSNSSGVAHMQNKDRTGAPGSETTCQLCHGGGNYVPTLEVSAIVGGEGLPGEAYTPGASHTLGVEVSSPGNPFGYGVHGTVLFQDGSNAGELLDQNPEDCVWLDDVAGRHIFEQYDVCNPGVFEVDWTAPPPGSGPVTIYVAAVAADGNGVSSGDVFVGGQFELNEGVVGTHEVSPPAFEAHVGEGGQLELWCNRLAQCAVFGLDGRILFDGDLAPGRHRLGIPYSGWIVVRLQSEAGEVWTKRIWIHS